MWYLSISIDRGDSYEDTHEGLYETEQEALEASKKFFGHLKLVKFIPVY